MKFECIHAYAKEYPVWLMCQVFCVSKSGYHRWVLAADVRSKRETAELKLVRIIEDIHTGSRGIYGSPKVAAIIQGLENRCSKGKVARLMKKFGIRSRTRRKHKKTTDSSHGLKTAPNLLVQDFKTFGPNQAWVGDITYVPTAKGWLYLATVIDLFSRKVIGWAFSDRLKREIVLRAFNMAVLNRQPGRGFVFHSDKGSQYASGDFRALLAKYGCLQSMSGRGNCWDNAVAESFFGILKRELVHLEKFESREHAMTSIFQWIEGDYNRTRIHSTLGYMSPLHFEEVFMRKVA